MVIARALPALSTTGKSNRISLREPEHRSSQVGIQLLNLLKVKRAISIPS